MEKKLQLIRHLYGEADDRSEHRRLLEDAEVKDEYQALSEIKFLLDHRKRERPDQDVLDRVFAVAAQKDVLSSPKGVRKDRGALPRQRSGTRRWLRSITTLVALFITVTIGYQWYQRPVGTETLQQAPLADEMEMDTEAPAAAKSMAPLEKSEEGVGTEAFRQFADSPTVDNISRERQEAAEPAIAGLTAVGLAATDTTVPEWNDLDDIRRVERRIDVLLEEFDEFNWGQPAIPLEMMPPGDSNALGSGLHQTGSRRPDSGNQ